MTIWHLKLQVHEYSSSVFMLFALIKGTPVFLFYSSSSWCVSAKTNYVLFSVHPTPLCSIKRYNVEINNIAATIPDNNQNKNSTQKL